jgi:hypothetical protein
MSAQAPNKLRPASAVMRQSTCCCACFGKVHACKVAKWCTQEVRAQQNAYSTQAAVSSALPVSRGNLSIESVALV